MSASLELQDSVPTRELYRDELNFAEFPLASVSTSLPKGQKTLEFTDEIFDKSTNQRVTRKLTITASDKYGLPTAMDDEVILGLIQLSGRRDFSSRRIYFTRYELLKLLNWSDDTRNYNRLEQSLNRWLGVTLYYDKAWWSKDEQCWVNEGFHILDHVQILDKERQRRASKKGEQSGKSSFVWNEIVFGSFKAGYLKQIDFEFYKKLESAVSKRLYRFLDKRFYHRQKLEFELRTFACEHIGLSKNYHNGELKRVLTPAVAELEGQGFIEKLPAAERFVKKAKGEWTVIFVRKERQPPIGCAHQIPELVSALIERGVKETSARTLAARVGESTIREKLAFFDWLVTRKDPRIKRNAPGFLYQSIAEDFSLPDDYRAAAALRSKPPERKVIPFKNRPVPTTLPAKEDSDREVINQFWNALSEDEQKRIELELVKNAPAFLRQQYVEGEEERGPLFQAVRQALINDYARRFLRPRPQK